MRISITKALPLFTLVALTLLFACKQEASNTHKQERNVNTQNNNLDNSEREEERTYGSKDLIATQGRRGGGNVIEVPPPKEPRDYTNAYQAIYEGLFTKPDKVGQTTAMSLFSFNQDGSTAQEYNQDEVNGLAQALKDFPDVKIQIHQHIKSVHQEKEEKTKLKPLVI